MPIVKDVVRTDRKEPFFSDATGTAVVHCDALGATDVDFDFQHPALNQLKRILVTFSHFNPKLSRGTWHGSGASAGRPRSTPCRL